jgi:hypothetical protein
MRSTCKCPAHLIDVMPKLGLTYAEDRAVILKQGHSQKHPPWARTHDHKAKGFALCRLGKAGLEADCRANVTLLIPVPQFFDLVMDILILSKLQIRCRANPNTAATLSRQ